MHVTPRAALLAALGAAAMLRSPGWAALTLVNTFVLISILGDVLLAGSVSKLLVERDGDLVVRLGAQATMNLTVTNTGRRRARGVLRDAWEPSAGAAGGRLRLDVPAGERRRLTLTLHPTRRGDRRPARLTVRTLGPLGVAGRQGHHLVPWRLRVLPPFRSRRHLSERMRRLKVIQGAIATRGVGRGTEIEGLRPYADGDDARSVDWRASARSRDLIVRVQRPERDRRVMICVDSGRTSATRIGDAPRLDHAFDAALLLTALAERAGDRVDLIVHDAVLRADVPSSAHGRLLSRQADAMATIEPALVECDLQALATLVLQRGRRRRLVVLITDLVGPVVEESLLPVLPALMARHTLLVAAVGDPALDALSQTGGEVHLQAAAQRALVDRRRVADGLRRMGVTVVDAPAEHFPAALADAYLQLKAAGRL